MPTQATIKNDRILKALRCQATDRPPVWMMRQAGRYLPEYQAIRSQFSFLDLCKNPVKAAEVSIQPYEIFGVDAIIMFSDILVPLEPMGSAVSFATGSPKFAEPIRTVKQVEDLRVLDKDELAKSCSFVYDTITEIKSKVNDELPVLGFAGAPWTLASYMIEGGGSKDFAQIKAFSYQHPQAMHMLLQKLSDTIADYLILKLDRGVDAVQLFDTWGSVLTQRDYQEFAMPYQQKIISKIRSVYPDASITLYVNGVANILDYMVQTGANCLSVDWRVNLAEVRSFVDGKNIAIQGNLDPCKLLGTKQSVIEETKRMLELAGNEPGYIANLGHGILPMVPVENARAFIETVKNQSS